MYCSLHVGVVGVAKMAKSGGEVRRADEDAVHSLDSADLIEVFHGNAALYLHQHTNLVVHGRLAWLWMNLSTTGRVMRRPL